ncbi:Pectate lyase superfamily protein [Maioricimonas rarisocia]|uniref:Pectate lyase superfamily protein n=1 Tax=Maioricimonas rarisocia TaxID=2528026 RepID=A0A517Z2A1_9PLAN|nr:right-handed parallel beta-helix repeat-containing protein [Maioricimonas rarisocia]QDU36598.1 Pectate lyase superfamily protein [Maioricimonas rarisocia]
MLRIPAERRGRFIASRAVALALLIALYGAWHGSPRFASSLKAQGEARVITTAHLAAVADGKADATATLQQLIDSGKGEIELPKGVYRLTAPIVVDLDRVGFTSISGNGVARLVMEAAGPALRIVGTHDGTAAPHTVKQNVWDRQRTPLVDALEIVGAHPEANGVELYKTMQPTLTRLTIRHCLHAVHIVTRNRNVQISDCHLYENRGVGVYMDGVNLHQINVVGCHISYNDGGGIVCRDSEIRNLQIAGCDIEGNMSPETEPTANVLLDCRNGSVREGAVVGCTIQHNHDSPDSANIRFLGESAEQPQKVGNFCISDNALSDVRVNIHLQHARGVTITGNTIWKGFDYNVLAEDCSHLVIGPNLFDRNPDYRPPNSTNCLVFRDCSDSTLTGLHVFHTLGTEAAVLLENCRWMNISGCTILDSDGAGLLLRGSDRCSVTNCVIRDEREDADDAPSIRIEGGRHQLSGNMVTGGIVD